jgi:hypothetical protein
MGRNVLSGVLVLAGLSLVALSLAADAIGIGAGEYSFGWEQKLGVAVGVTVVWFTVLRALGWHLRTRQEVVPAREAPRTASASA